jgi:hypothetical protein
MRWVARRGFQRQGGALGFDAPGARYPHQDVEVIEFDDFMVAGN